MSKSNWENSLFGGYRNVLRDYPDINVSFKVNKKMPEKFRSELGYHGSSTLMDLFLLRIVKLGLTKVFLSSAVEKDTPFGKVMEIEKSSQRHCLETIISDKTDELVNMFIHFQDVLDECSFSVDKPEEDEEDSKGNKGDADEKDKKKTLETYMEGEVNKTCIYEKKKSTYNDSLSSSNFTDKTTFITRAIGREDPLTPQMETCASNLVNLLDVNFEMDSDVVNNLRFGKIDPAKISQIEAGNFHIYNKVYEEQKTKPFSVCMLCDESGSMGSMEGEGGNNSSSPASNQYYMIRVLYRAFSQIIPKERISVYGHSGVRDPEIYVYHDKYNPNFEKTIRTQIKTSRQQNYDGPVIEKIHERVRGFDQNSILFISLSDGEPAGHNYGGQDAMEELKKIIEKCRRDRFVTVGIGLSFGAIKYIYNYSTVITDYTKMVKQVSTLINTVVKKEFKS